MGSILRTRRRRRQLVDVLGMIAAYNDKGADWSGHDPEQVSRFRQETQERILLLVAEIGQKNFSPQLLDALISGRASEDWTGEIRILARKELL